ncbi:MAG: hypothetical protein RIB59_09230 [Rhodospirillales bacterium]
MFRVFVLLCLTATMVSACAEIQNIWPLKSAPDTKSAVAAIAPGALIGLDQGEVRRVMGAPGAERKVAAATVWSYRAKDCSLDIFFYQDLKTRTFRALSYDAKASKDPKNEEVIRSCIARIRENNGAGRT